MSKNSDILDMIDAYLVDVGNMSKTASIGDNTPNGEVDPKVGSRSSENTSDVKASIPNSVDSTAEGGKTDVGGLKTQTNSIGTKKDETGKNVPSAPVKPHPDPGTEHPAKTTAKEASLNELVGMANDILAELAVMAKSAEEAQKAEGQTANPNKASAEVKKAEVVKAEATEKPVEKTPEAPVEKAASDTSPELTDQQLGYLTGKYIAESLIKQAQEQSQEQVKPASDEQLTKLAEQEAQRLYQRADTLSDYLVQYLNSYVKSAGDDAGGMPPVDPAQGAPAPVPGPEAGAPPAGGEGGGDLPPELLALAQALIEQGVTPEQLEQLLAQAQSEGGAGGPPAGGAGPAPEGGAAPAGDKVDEAVAAAGGGAQKEASAKPSKTDLVKTAAAVKAAIEKARSTKK